ncbi:DMT family transporter [Siansivirga zeaxanthinifaciens]|uniref:Permease n=1 Tax=Siansivirga zeaxanthinifaciens CC-SAMT-1 TaxID=1454006 RepID=A0A0C5WBX4_9FLAO|nr:DMT family transporter [Siansivirga zeaxanthinifaciens]AJR04598.1 permease [Siansivirga zeaxanthinifaciens CC-SAMT-1]
MLNDKIKNYLHLHLLVFIAGFTAILGELIIISAIPLVWFRMVFASSLMLIYIKFAKVKLSIRPKELVRLAIAGIIIALHWITFFGAIDESNISITLTMFSTGAFFASFIEPIFYKRRILWYEILFGVIVIIGVYVISRGELKYINGIILGITSAFLSSLFAVLNGTFIKKHQATVIAFYEFLSGVLFVSIFLLFSDKGFSRAFFNISLPDLGYLLILASICTTYAYIASIHVMRFLSPYTVVLTYNLEPVYGIIMAILLFPDKEHMGPNFYFGALIIIVTVLANGILKNIKTLKNRRLAKAVR